MPEKPGFSIAAQEPIEGKTGATAAFPYNRMTVERFRTAFPGARWRDDLRAWFVPGTTAERRLNRWLGREMSGVLAYADERGRDAFAFQPVESHYLEVADDLRIRTPYSRTVVDELRAVPWAWRDGELKAWRVPFRSWDDLQRRWPAIEAAARRNEPAERQKRRQIHQGTPEQREAAARATERRQRRYPIPDEPLPPLERVVMTHQGAVIFTDITGELADDALVTLLPGRLYRGCHSRVGDLAQADPRCTRPCLAGALGRRRPRLGARMVATDHCGIAGRAT
jgi:hypothetical protein